jgi:hypothetical protein
MFLLQGSSFFAMSINTKSKNINQVNPLSSTMDLAGLLERLEEEIKIDLRVGGRKVVEVKIRDKNIHMDIMDAHGFKGLIKRVRN